ncbi:hypothetical protein, partial [Paracoccus sp. SY]|uniref:hypothetical protein n=1 Tax=Paracoccus sp. SY TaxID=1330255 RepID=UPI001961B1F8
PPGAVDGTGRKDRADCRSCSCRQRGKEGSILIFATYLRLHVGVCAAASTVVCAVAAALISPQARHDRRLREMRKAFYRNMPRCHAPGPLAL